ncbi:MAG: hypothetical protein EOP11_16155 [Proteobacteria bacterium]|nr:MAG: hypothetical protein EOP11_16155 [Pseudomonadota bacterium]
MKAVYLRLVVLALSLPASAHAWYACTENVEADTYGLLFEDKALDKGYVLIKADEGNMADEIICGAANDAGEATCLPARKELGLTVVLNRGADTARVEALKGGATITYEMACGPL